MEMQIAERIFRDANVAPDEKMPALCTDPHFVEGPPVLQRIGIPEEVQFTSIGLRKRHHQSISARDVFVSCEVAAKSYALATGS